MSVYQQPADESAPPLDRAPSTIDGLTSREAARCLEKYGPNELPTRERHGLLALVAEAAREPMFLLLLVSGGVYLLVGDLQEALVLLGFVFFVLGITIYQERRTERALEALRDLSSPRALVVRDGQRQRIAGREVVVGDLLVLAEGDRVAADGVLRSSLNLRVDESFLTGESVPVGKESTRDDVAMGTAGGENSPFVYAGTLVVDGEGLAQVQATGAHTEMGKIGRSLQSPNTAPTHLQVETRRLVRVLAVVGLVLCVLAIVVYGLTRGDWLNGVLVGITMAMAMIPEEFPVVLTVFLALGAWRLARVRVLTRRATAIQALGAATVLCVDKTGTLTMNRMAVQQLVADGAVATLGGSTGEPIPETVHPVVEYGILASRSDPFDPMERAIQNLGSLQLANTEHLHPDWLLVREYPLTRSLLAMARVWAPPDTETGVVATKGAPEAIAQLCHLTTDETEDLVERIAELAEHGLRVLGVACGLVTLTQLPDRLEDIAFRFVGLLALSDPVRPEVPASIQACQEAGIRVVMVTGDYPITAQSIARQAGLANPEQVITGTELATLDEATLATRARDVSVFARVVPEQKLRLVKVLQAGGQVVAMTGDGVNDAPALRAADIGIAMGGRGTDVAREAADLVLLDDSFAAIVGAVRLGRTIYDNLRKAMAYILATHVPIAVLSLVPVLIQWPLILLPMHIAFLELVIDPTCSVGFEAEPSERDVMNRPPRDPREPLFGPRTIGVGLLQGVSVALIVLGVFAVALAKGHDVTDARALTFATLVVANLGLLLANRSWSRIVLATLRDPNPALWWIVGGTLLVLSAVLYVPPLRDLFRFSFLHLDDLAIALVAGLASIAWFEMLKVVTKGSALMRSPTGTR